MATGGAGGGGAHKRDRAWDLIDESLVSQRTHNPIRAIVDTLVIPKGRELIPLSLGDPTVFGNLHSPPCMKRAVAEALTSGKHDGYCHSAGIVAARKAIAASSCLPGADVTADDVVIANGASGALDLAIGALCNPGDTFLVPQPGFSLYETLAKSKGVTVKHYRLDPERQWEVDLEHLESLINNRVTAILLNNPSNPCGSVYSEAHLRAILAVAERHRVPIIADEIYGNLTWEGKFHPLASLTDTVPIISVSGMAKIFMVPGWRVGWAVVYDRHGALGDVRKALFKMSQLILGACHLVQTAVPAVLAPTSAADKKEIAAVFEGNRAELEKNATFTADELEKIPGLRPVRPQGAMYVMVGMEEGAFKDLSDDKEFCQALLTEESVFCLPGQCFGMRNFIRIVFCAPQEKLTVAFERMAAFCKRHHV